MWKLIKSIFVNDAHEIISERGKQILADQQKYTFISNGKASRTESETSDLIIDRNGKRKRPFKLKNPQFFTDRELASQILLKHEDNNEYHFHRLDREWIIDAMIEFKKTKNPS
jgi:hypothetical protein